MSATLVHALVGIVAIAAGYLFGSIPNGVLIGKIFFGKDPRDYGSHNSGGTNTGRVFGYKVGLICIFLDMIKVLIPIYGMWAFLAFSGIPEQYGFHEWASLAYLWLVPVAGTLGHCYPLYLGFKGGKAVACFYGVLGGTTYVGMAFGLVTYLGILKLKKIVSYTSIISSFISLVFLYCMATIQWLLPSWNSGVLFFNFGVGGLLYFSFPMCIAFTIMFLILVFRHSSNIRRMREGNESKVKWLK